MAEFQACHNIVSAGFGISFVQWQWPDGRSYLEQPVTRVTAFRIILAEAMAAMAQRAKASSHG